MGIPPVHPNESNPRQGARSTNNLSPECCAILERIPGAGLKGPGYPENVLGQLMHSPDLLAPFLNWWVTSKSSMSFGERQQELVILRIGCLYASDYVRSTTFQWPRSLVPVMRKLKRCGWGALRLSTASRGPCSR